MTAVLKLLLQGACVTVCIFMFVLIFALMGPAPA